MKEPHPQDHCLLAMFVMSGGAVLVVWLLEALLR
jgi:hypothetical protein